MKNKFCTVLSVVILCVSLSISLSMPVLAAEYRDSRQEETVQHSLSGEELSELMGFVKEKWDSGSLKTKEDILSAMTEGEEKFGISLGRNGKEQLAGVILKLDEIGLDHDAAISLAKKLYERYGDSLADYAAALYEEYGESLASNVEKIIKEELGPVGEAIKDNVAKPLEDTIKDQVIEPAKEAAKEAASNAVKDFWRDLKDSVVSFFKNIFE